MTVPAEAIQAAQEHDHAHLRPGWGWARVADDQVERLLTGAAPLIAAAERKRIRQHLAGLVVNGSDGPVRVTDLIRDRP